VAVGIAKARETHSNILRADYVGSTACATCHAKVYAKWSASPMRQMTRDPDRATLRAPFAGETFEFKADSATLFREGAARLIRIASPGGSHLFRVTRVIGNHYREDFAGVEVATATDEIHRGFGPELVLPVTYYYESQGYRPKGYSVMTHERPGLRAGGVWNRTCIFCHNTVPWLDSILGELAGPSHPTYQGVTVDRLLPPERRFGYHVTRAAAFRAAVADEAAFVTASTPRAQSDDQGAARAGIRSLDSHFEGRHLVEEGIGCEVCHGGGREHVADPHVRTSYSPRSDFLEVRPETGKPSQALLINRTCARCHQVLFSRYPYTWEGGRRYGGPLGGSTTSSGEARDFLLGGPGRNLACTACHDPHALDRPEVLARLETPAGNVVCLGCHRSYASAEGLAAHTHHDVSGPGSACIACHMPRKNMALDYSLDALPPHRLADGSRARRGRPSRWNVRPVPRRPERLLPWSATWSACGGQDVRPWPAARTLYGDLGRQRPAWPPWCSGRPHEQVVAAMVLAEQHKTARRRLRSGAAARQAAIRWPVDSPRKALSVLLADKPCALDVDGSPDGYPASARLLAAGWTRLSCRSAPLLPGRSAASARNEPDEED
jgi:predicted CXXCH cytochrome family protein